MAAASETTNASKSKRTVYIEDLTIRDQKFHLQKYLCKFGVLKFCDIYKGKDLLLHGIGTYRELKSVDNIMKKENRPHQINGHNVYISRMSRETSNTNNLRAHRDICTLVLCVQTPNAISDEELNQHFAQYGSIILFDRIGSDVKITYDDYDPVDKAYRNNPHTLNNIVLRVGKYLNLATINADTSTLKSLSADTQASATPQHHKSDTVLANTSTIGSSLASKRSTGARNDEEKLSHVGPSITSQSTGSITSVNDQSFEAAGRLFGNTIRDVKEQGNPDLPNDVPPEWTSANLQSEDAGGQSEVRIIYHKNNPKHLAAIKIYTVEAKRKRSENFDDYLKERRMRAHRELTALKTLHGVENTSQVTHYSSDFTNIPDTAEDAIDGENTYWIIMKYIHGDTLEAFMEDFGEIDLLNAIKLTQKLLLTIKKIHARGVVHRDIKPMNLLITCDPSASVETAEIHVIDFGLSYIENREDDVDYSSFEEKEGTVTRFHDTLENSFFRPPQLNSASIKKMTSKEKNVLMYVRRSPTIDASSVCAILFWLVTGIEPGPKVRNETNLAPHYRKKAVNIIRIKVDEAANLTGIAKELLLGLQNQLTNYLMSTFDKGFENAEHQWTVEQLECRLESFRHILEQNITSLDQQLSDVTKSLLSLESATIVSSQLYPVNLIFQKVSRAYQSAKRKFVARHSSCSWYDDHCHWLEYQQDMTQRKNYDLLTYERNKKKWMLLVVCSVHFNDNGDTFTLAVGSDFNGVYIEIPLARFAPEELDNLNIEVEFERELINLLQIICKTKHAANTETPPSSDGH